MLKLKHHKKKQKGDNDPRRVSSFQVADICKVAREQVKDTLVGRSSCMVAGYNSRVIVTALQGP